MYPCPFSTITLICVPNAVGQIAVKTDGRNSLRVSRVKEVENQSPGKMNSLNDTHSPKSDIPVAAGHHAVMNPCEGNPLLHPLISRTLL